MTPISLAKSYARALFRRALEDQKIQWVAKELDVWGKSLSPYQSLLAKVSKAERQRMGQDWISSYLAHEQQVEWPPFKEFLLLINQYDRWFLLPLICDAYQKIADEHEGVLRGEVLTTKPLDDSMLKGISQKLSLKMQKKIILKPRLQDSLLGGVTLKLGPWTMDDSLKNHIDKLIQKIIH